MHLYETHLPVANTGNSAQFYLELVGLAFAYRDPGRDIVFLWVGTDRRSMLGLWGPTTLYGKDPHRCHFAIALFAAGGPPGGRPATQRLGHPDEQLRRPGNIRAVGDRLDAIRPQLYFPRSRQGIRSSSSPSSMNRPDPGFIGPSSRQWREERLSRG